MCKFITMHAWIVKISWFEIQMMTADKSWVDWFQSFGTQQPGPGHVTIVLTIAMDGQQSRTSNPNSKLERNVRGCGLPQVYFPTPQKMVNNETIHPKFTRFDSMMIRDHKDSGLKTRWVSRPLSLLWGLHTTHQRDISIFGGVMFALWTATRSMTKHDTRGRYTDILLMVQKSGKLTSWYMVNTFPVVWDFFHQQYYRFALSFNSAIEKNSLLLLLKLWNQETSINVLLIMTAIE